MTERKSGCLLVAAIQIGATHSGYAFSMRHDFEVDPLKIQTNQDRTGRGTQLVSWTPTSLLLDANRKFVAFGYEAENIYTEMEGQQNDYFFFHRFEMSLHSNTKFNSHIIVEDINGKTVLAVDVFALIIRAIVDNVIHRLGCQGTGVRPNEIQWVLTVPVQWIDNSKEFMRESAIQAGLQQDKLFIIKEPKAAFIFSQYLPVKITSNFGFTITAGIKHIIMVDLDSTVEVAVYESLIGGGEKNIYRAARDVCGGTSIDYKLIQLFENVLGKTFLNTMKRTYLSSYLDLLREIEAIKSRITSTTKKINIPVPYPTLDRLCQQCFRTEFSSMLTSSYPSSTISMIHDKIRIDAELFNSFFDKTLKCILELLQDMIERREFRTVTLIILLGSIFEYEIVLDKIRKAFPTKRIVRPNECDLSTVKGAVLYGHTKLSDLSDSGQQKEIPVSLEHGQYIQGSNREAKAGTIDKNIQLPWLVDGVEFQRMLSHGEYLSYENRLSLGGPCRAGKSTLASVLIGEHTPLQWNSTDGLVIYFGRNGIDIENKKMIPLQEGERGHDVLAKILRGKPNISTKSDQTSSQENQINVRRFSTDVHTALSSESETNFTQDDNKITKYSTDQFETKSYVSVTKSDMEHLSQQMSTKCLTSATTEIQTLDCQKLQLQSEILEEVRNGQYRIRIAPSDLTDFGGQKSYDMTHQLFIQHRGSFLLMFDGRLGLHQQLDEYPEGFTAACILKYWVDSILTYTCYTEDTEDSMPMILFAATHRDQCKGNIAKVREGFIRDVRHMFSYHEKIHHTHLDTVYFINGIDKDDPEIKHMTDQVVLFAMQQSSWGQPRPMQWVPLELQISNMKMKNVNIITKEDLTNVNRLNDDLALSEDQMTDFLLVQHSLVKLIYYNLSGLDKYIIIHPPALVNILRSFVTDEKFFPADQNLSSILQTLTHKGKINKKLWQQEHFHQYMQNDSIKEFVIQLLVHLDVLIVPKALEQSSTDVFLVPCMIKTIRPDFSNLLHHKDRTICLKYSLAQNSILSSLVYKVIGAAIITWPLKEEENKPNKPCLYHQAAVFNVSEEDELRIWLEDNQIMVYLTNKKSLLSISPDVAASIQECLTKIIESALLFYFNSFGKKIKPSKVLELYTLALGVPCGNGVCFKSVEEVNETYYWTCERDKKHEAKYLLYWIFDKSQKMCAVGCEGLSYVELKTRPSEKHLVRLGSQIGIHSFQDFYLHLGMTTRQWENISDLYERHSREGIMAMALVKWKESKLSEFKYPSLKDLSEALEKVNLDKHVICQVFKEDTKLLDNADSNLQKIPSDGVLKELSKQVGNCALQLGIELGVSVNEVENSLFKFRKKLPDLIEDILKKWKAKSKIKTFRSLMLALQRVKGGGMRYLHEMSKENEHCMSSTINLET